MNKDFTIGGVHSGFEIRAFVEKDSRMKPYREQLSRRGMEAEKVTDLLEGIFSAQLTESGNGYVKRFRSRMNELIRIREELTGIYEKVLELPSGKKMRPADIEVGRLKELYKQLERNLDELSQLSPKDAFNAGDVITDVKGLLAGLEGGRGETPSAAPGVSPSRGVSTGRSRPRKTRRPALPKDLAALAGGDAQAAAGLRRLIARDRKGLIEDLIAEYGENENSREIGRDYLRDLNSLNEKQIDGIAEFQRLDEATSQLGDNTWYDILNQDSHLKHDLLSLVGELKDVVDEGMLEAVERGLRKNETGTDIQGVLGHFYAARELSSMFPGARLKFEVFGPNREIDIQVLTSGRTIDVEVKTNLSGSPSVNDLQIKRDLIRHAKDGWEDLLYRYAPQSGDLESVRQAMRDLLKDPEVATAWKRGGMDSLAKAQERLKARLQTKQHSLVDFFGY